MTPARVVALTASACALLAVVGLSGIGTTDASWTTAETGSGALTAGVVNPPRATACNQPPLQTPIFTWSAPVAGGLSISSYHWSLTNTATSVVATSGDVTGLSVQPNAGLLATGTFTFTVIANGPGGWTSVAAPTGTYRVAVGLLTSCTVP